MYSSRLVSSVSSVASVSQSVSMDHGAHGAHGVHEARWGVNAPNVITYDFVNVRYLVAGMETDGARSRQPADVIYIFDHCV